MYSRTQVIHNKGERKGEKELTNIAKNAMELMASQHRPHHIHLLWLILIEILESKLILYVNVYNLMQLFQVLVPEHTIEHRQTVENGRAA